MTIINDAVQIAHDITKGLELQTQVSLQPFTGQSSSEKQYDPIVHVLTAVVEYRKQRVKSTQGIVVESTCSVIFLDKPALLAATAGKGLHVEDKLWITSTGQKMPIAHVGGYMDTNDGLPCATEAYIG